jgi:hypothetical protein
VREYLKASGARFRASFDGLGAQAVELPASMPVVKERGPVNLTEGR